MRAASIVFYVIAAITALASVGVVAARNVLHAALALAGSLLGAAAVFVLFGAEFVGLVQILVYVCAVVVLFLFGIMLTAPRTGTHRLDNNQRPLAAVASLGLFILLAVGILTSFGGTKLELRRAFSTEALGNELFTRWILPFEAVSVLLLAALVGAIVLARRD